MKVPLFQALLDVQNLSQLYHGLHYTQSVAVHIKNNQLEMPLLSKLTVTSPTQPTERFLDYIEQIINVYEPTLYGIKIQTATDTIVKKNHRSRRGTTPCWKRRPFGHTLCHHL